MSDTANRLVDPNADVDRVQNDIARQLDYLRRVIEGDRKRLANAEDAAGRFAAAVYEMLEHPGPESDRRCQSAYDRFMSLHAGGFTLSWTEADLLAIVQS